MIEYGTFKQVLHKLISPIDHDSAIDPNDLGKSVCIKHCYRGNPSGGRLWSIWSLNGKSWITVVGLRKHGKDTWWWIAEQEKFFTFGFVHVDCPLKYLDIVPCPKSKEAAQWRQRVYAYHNERVAKRLAKKAAKEAKKKEITENLQETAEKLKKEAEEYVNSIKDECTSSPMTWESSIDLKPCEGGHYHAIFSDKPFFVVDKEKST